MQVELTAEQQALKQEIRRYLAEVIMTPDLREEMTDPELAEGGGPVFREKLARMGADGWIGLSWPRELGGRHCTAMDQYLFSDEVIRAGFAYPFLTIDAIAPVLAEHADASIRDEVVGGVRRGEVVIAIGYSEPGAGTDLASLTTRAMRDGDDWIVNGQKIWTSLANFADYVWVAARTDPDAAKKHKGLTMFLVPTDIEGFSHTPIRTLGVRTNVTYYENIRLSDRFRVGEVNGGWKLITGQLNRERLSLVTHGQIESLFEGVCEWAAATADGSGRPLLQRPWVQSNLAKVAAGLEVLKLICYKQAWAMESDAFGMAEASMAKIYGTEFFVEAYRLLLEVMEQAGTIRAGSPGEVLRGRLEHRYRCGSILTFGGGTNEVQRDIIAMAGLWMPRSR